MAHFKSNPFDERPNWVEEYTKTLGLIGQRGLSGQMGMSGVQGVCGQQGVSGIQRVQGQLGHHNDVHIDSLSVRDFVNNIPAISIENAVLEILEKHGIYTKDSSVRINDDILGGTMGPNDDGVQDAYQKDKTFTLDEVITIIDSSPVKMNVNRGGIWENTTEHLIDKNELIKKLKSLCN